MHIRLAAFLSLLLLGGCASSRPPPLQVWIWDYNPETQKLFRDNLVPRFQAAHPGVKVNVEFIPPPRLDEKLAITFAGGVSPDIFQAGAEYVGGLVHRGQVLCLDDYVHRWGQGADFYRASWNTCVYRGRVYGLPYLSAPHALLYRKDLLQQAGFSRPPEDWPELVEWAVKLTRRRGETITLAGINLRVTWQTFVNFLWQNGGELFSADGRRCLLDRPEAIEALQFYVDLYHKHKVGTIASLPIAGGGVPVFASGRAAMDFANQLGVKNLEKYAPALLPKVGVAALPMKKKRVLSVYTDWLAISSQSKQKDLAWEFIAFLMEPENLVAYNETLFYLPPRRSCAQARFLRENPQLQVFIELMDKYGRSLPPLPEWFEIRSALGAAVEAAIYRTKTPAQALRDATRDINQLLAERK
jgi:ABC-type glycerol-3-phosphate transport system substrate-binding protein